MEETYQSYRAALECKNDALMDLEEVEAQKEGACQHGEAQAL